MASKKRRKKIREQIAEMHDEDRRRLYKQAARLRRAASEPRPRPKHRPDYEDWNDDDALPDAMEKRKRRHKGSLREWAEALVLDGETGAREVAPREPEALGSVLFATSGTCRVLTDEGETLDCRLAPDLVAVQRSDLAVGDRVEIQDLHEEPVVVGIRPRRSVLSRHDSGPGGTRVERVIAANVDRAVIVAAACEPPLRPRLLDRYLVAVAHGGAGAAIAVTKVDLLDAAGRRDILAAVEAHRSVVPVVLCSSTSGEGLDALREELAGETAVLVGQSGVGKSSLLNALEPELQLDTRTVGSQRKGRHTTTASTLYELGGGTRLIDTPGVREFGLWDVGRDELRSYFPEFEEWSDGCRYRDCAHDREPQCGVRDAVEAGQLPAGRYESYRRLLSDCDRS